MKKFLILFSVLAFIAVSLCLSPIKRKGTFTLEQIIAFADDDPEEEYPPPPFPPGNPFPYPDTIPPGAEPYYIIID